MQVQIKGNKIFVPLKNEWVVLSPEEQVRQEYICRLVDNYGFGLEQMEQDVKLKNSNAHADILIWSSSKSKKESKAPLIVVECKAEQITIRVEDYYRGALYAGEIGARFFVTTNQKETRIFSKAFKVNKDAANNLTEILNIPNAEIAENKKEVDSLLNLTLDFAKEDFNKLLHRCHNIIRNNDKLSPEAAFDEISKILFVKITYERRNKSGQIYTLKEYKEDKRDYEKSRKQDAQPYYRILFDRVKKEFKSDDLFDSNETIKIKENSFEDIVKELEVYNLSTTSDDVKGIAFEKFLGRTFRGELGQFFTPRTVVDYMVEILDPKEGEIICDPCCGSGGFLIKSFEYVREKIETNIEEQKEKLKQKYYTSEYHKLTEKEQEKINRKVNEEINNLNKELDTTIEGSRLQQLSSEFIFGTDANPRMARTAKMNMIMHGDGHGGVHHHDGLLPVNGIFDGRFDVILTNPPFGARVEKSLKITEQDAQTDEKMIEKYGEPYVKAFRKVKINIGKPISSLFRTAEMSSLTEILFLEKCLNLLKPGGRLGIVLPEGVMNNNALEKVRNHFEHLAQILNITSIPQDVFIASGASIKPSILFLKKYTLEELSKQYVFERKFVFTSERSLEIISPDHAVRKKINYPIALIDIKDAGITSIGTESNNNELPRAIKEYRKFVDNPKYKDFEITNIQFYKKLINWSVSHNSAKPIYAQTEYPNVELQEFLKKNGHTIKVQPSVMYKRITIRTNNNGISMRDELPGAKIGTKRQYLVKAGQFAISKIDARNGAMGIIPPYLEGAIVTPDFLTYDINTELILPEYLELVTSTPSFVEFCRKFSSGTTNRQRLNEKLFLHASIPLPPLEVQRAMVKEITQLRNTIAKAEKKLTEAKTNFEQTIFNP